MADKWVQCGLPGSSRPLAFGLDVLACLVTYGLVFSFSRSAFCFEPLQGFFSLNMHKFPTSLIKNNRPLTTCCLCIPSILDQNKTLRMVSTLLSCLIGRLVVLTVLCHCRRRAHMSLSALFSSRWLGCRKRQIFRDSYLLV